MAILFRPVLVVDESHWVPALRQGMADYDMRIWPDIGNPEDIEYLIAWRVFEGEAEAYPNLKAVLSLSAGVNQYMGNPNFPKNAKLIRMIEPGLDQAMIEYVLSYVMRFHREQDLIDPAIADNWGGVMCKFTSQRTVGILGLGHLGQVCAAPLKQLGFNVRGWSRTQKNVPGVKCFAGQEQLAEFLSETEILVCLLPFTPETENILNKETMGQLPKGAFLINAARGQLIVDEDLVALLDSGHLAQAALDVFRKEPLPKDHPFWDNPKVLITPHIAAITAIDTGIETLKTNIKALERGETPKGFVDIQQGY